MATVVEDALRAYQSSVAGTHGMSGRDLAGLIWPLGLVEADVDELLLDALTDWGSLRDQAAHVRVGKVRSVTSPDLEWTRFKTDLLPMLEKLDESLATAVCA